MVALAVERTSCLCLCSGCTSSPRPLPGCRILRFSIIVEIGRVLPEKVIDGCKGILDHEDHRLMMVYLALEIRDLDRIHRAIAFWKAFPGKLRWMSRASDFRITLKYRRTICFRDASTVDFSMYHSRNGEPRTWTMLSKSSPTSTSSDSDQKASKENRSQRFQFQRL